MSADDFIRFEDEDNYHQPSVIVACRNCSAEVRCRLSCWKKRGYARCKRCSSQSHGHSRPPSKAYTAWSNLRTAWKLRRSHGVPYPPAWDNFETFLADIGEPPDHGRCRLRRLNQDAPWSAENAAWVEFKPRRGGERWAAQQLGREA